MVEKPRKAVNAVADMEHKLDLPRQRQPLMQEDLYSWSSSLSASWIFQASVQESMPSCFHLQIAGDEPEGGWTKWTFQFKSRRLENFVFAVEVERLDQTLVSASVAQGQVQRMVQSVQENVDEKQGVRVNPDFDTLAAFVVRMPGEVFVVCGGGRSADSVFGLRFCGLWTGAEKVQSVQEKRGREARCSCASMFRTTTAASFVEFWEKCGVFAGVL
jgi:hypothetical protein